MIEQADLNPERTRMYLGMECRMILTYDLEYDYVQTESFSYNKEKVVNVTYRQGEGASYLFVAT
jgi:hypothetical protein